jgi:hypothetical protein
MDLHMPQSTMESIEPPAGSRNHWTLQRGAADEWCSLDCNDRGWKLRMHVGEFSVMAEAASDGRDTGTMDQLRSRLRALGWSEAPRITLRPKRDRRAERR